MQKINSKTVTSSMLGVFRSVLHCTVLYCTVLYCAVLYCTVFRDDPKTRTEFLSLVKQ